MQIFYLDYMNLTAVRFAIENNVSADREKRRKE